MKFGGIELEQVRAELAKMSPDSQLSYVCGRAEEQLRVGTPKDHIYGYVMQTLTSIRFAVALELKRRFDPADGEPCSVLFDYVSQWSDELGIDGFLNDTGYWFQIHKWATPGAFLYRVSHMSTTHAFDVTIQPRHGSRSDDINEPEAFTLAVSGASTDDIFETQPLTVREVVDTLIALAIQSGPKRDAKNPAVNALLDKHVADFHGSTGGMPCLIGATCPLFG